MTPPPRATRTGGWPSSVPVPGRGADPLEENELTGQSDKIFERFKSCTRKTTQSTTNSTSSINIRTEGSRVLNWVANYTKINTAI